MIWIPYGLIDPGEFCLSSKRLANIDDETLLLIVKQAIELSQHPFLEYTHCNGLANFDSVDEFFAAYREELIKQESVKRKRQLTKLRRGQFSAKRAALELALIERDGYVCQIKNCQESENLTIDHVLPISKGGTDELSNLQFLCRSHNSSKGDK